MFALQTLQTYWQSSIFSNKSTFRKKCLDFCRYLRSRPDVLYLKDVFKYFSKFTGKHMCRNLFLIKLRPATLLKYRLSHMFSCDFCEIFKNTFFIKHIWHLWHHRSQLLEELNRIQAIQYKFFSIAKEQQTYFFP